MQGLLGQLIVIMRFILTVGLLSRCSLPSASSEPESWAKQLAAAQTQAHRVDPAAVLYDVIAGPPARQAVRGEVHTLEIRFDFVRPSGDVLMVELEDTAVARTVSRAEPGTRASLAPDELARLKSASATIRISPAEALQHTSGLAQAFATQHNVKVKPIIGLEMSEEVQKVFGIPAAWSVLYLDPNSTDLRVWVNPQTGEILGETDNTKRFP